MRNEYKARTYLIRYKDDPNNMGQNDAHVEQENNDMRDMLSN